LLGPKSYWNPRKRDGRPLCHFDQILLFHLLFKITFSDFLFPHRNTWNKAWLSSWRILLGSRITPPCTGKFPLLYLPRSTIVKFCRLRLGHYLLPYHSFRISLNSSPFCTLHTSDAYCNICHIIFSCPSLSYELSIFFSNFPFTATPLPALNFFLTLVFLPLFFYLLTLFIMLVS